MSLTTVTLALDDKLRSLRNSSFDTESEKDSVTDINISTTTAAATTSTASATTAVVNSIQSTSGAGVPNQPLTLGENIPYADESPERPLIQTRSKPVRLSASVQPTPAAAAARYPASPRPFGQRPTTGSDASMMDHHPHHHHMPKVATVQPTQIATNLLAPPPTSVSPPDCGSSDDTDASTTSNSMEGSKFPPPIIDRDMIREMSRILQTLERKATKLNRSLSLNYKSHKDCCCNNNNNNNSSLNNQNNANLANIAAHGAPHHGSGGAICWRQPSGGLSTVQQQRQSSLAAAAALTKDEKTDKNTTNKKRQIQDGKNHRRYTNRSIKRRHTVGGTHDYDAVKTSQVRSRCQHPVAEVAPSVVVAVDGGAGGGMRTSSPDLLATKEIATGDM